MDFDDTPEEAAFRARVRAWLEANAEPRRLEDGDPDPFAERIDEAAVRAAKAWQRKKAEAGWACLGWPPEYGGRGASAIEQVVWAQEEARFRTPPDVFIVGHGMCGPTILAHGTPEQRARWLPKLITGEELWCQLFSEPGAGSDLAGLRTSAVRDGDGWIVDGQKIWTTGAQHCDWGILLARHDPSLPKHQGLTFFAVDMHAPGIEVRPIEQMNGGQGFNEVFFSGVRIPDANRIDEVGAGWRVAITTLMNERVSAGRGIGRGAEDLLELALRIEIEGSPALEDRAVRERVAELYVRARGIELTGCRILSALSQGRMPGPEASLMKLVGVRLAQEVSSYAMDLQGLAGAIVDGARALDAGRWPQRYLGIPGMRIAGGTDEILRNVIAQRILQLPAEERRDKAIAFRDVPSGPPRS